jgi:hypothetical protein
MLLFAACNSNTASKTDRSSSPSAAVRGGERGLASSSYPQTSRRLAAAEKADGNVLMRNPQNGPLRTFDNYEPDTVPPAQRPGAVPTAKTGPLAPYGEALAQTAANQPAANGSETQPAGTDQPTNSNSGGNAGQDQQSTAASGQQSAPATAPGGQTDQAGAESSANAGETANGTDHPASATPSGGTFTPTTSYLPNGMVAQTNADGTVDYGYQLYDSYGNVSGFLPMPAPGQLYSIHRRGNVVVETYNPVTSGVWCGINPTLPGVALNPAQTQAESRAQDGAIAAERNDSGATAADRASGSSAASRSGGAYRR